MLTARQKAVRQRYRRENPERFREAQRRYRAKNVEKCRDSVRRSQYSLALGQYEAMLKKQKSACAICRRKCDSGLSFAVDHDHRCCPGSKSCGACVGGLLCRKCNSMLGNAQDDARILARAIKYLRKWRSGLRRVK